MVRKKRLTKVNTLTIAEVERALSFTQPGLAITEARDVILAEGVYIVTDGPNGIGPIARYEIGIIFPKIYPSEEPSVYETAGTVERVADRHMYPSGRCCTCIWEEWLAKSIDTSVEAFCDGPLHNFFLSQFMFDKTRKWPFGDRSHGVDGVIEAIGDLLGVGPDEDAARRYIEIVAAREIKGHWACPCGSGKRLRNCHNDYVRELRGRVKHERAQKLLERLIETKLQERATPMESSQQP